MDKLHNIPDDWLEVYERSLENLSKDNRVRRFIANLAYLETRQRMECAEYFDREVVENADVRFYLFGQQIHIELLMPGKLETELAATDQRLGNHASKLH